MNETFTGVTGASPEWINEQKRRLGGAIAGASLTGANLAGQPAQIVDPWKHRSAGMTCSTCMWFAPKASERLGERSFIGRCRRHAPTMNGYPVVYTTDWCGDHKLDENKL